MTSPSTPEKLLRILTWAMLGFSTLALAFVVLALNFHPNRDEGFRGLLYVSAGIFGTMVFVLATELLAKWWFRPRAESAGIRK